MAKEKARYFTFLLYPDSIPEDWELRLELIGVPIAISPLHDKDLSSVEGQLYKKAHYHVLYVAKNPVTADSVRVRIKRALGEQSVALVQIVLNIENMYLYLTHESKDAIEKKKHKYDKADIKHLNNFDIDRYVTLDAEQKDDILDEGCNIIADYRLANILELKNFVSEKGAEYGLPTMKVINSVLRSHTGLIRLYFDGVYQERKYGSSAPVVDAETGEILTRSVVVIKNGELIINEQIPVSVSDRSIYMRVDIMWEDAGYSNYRELGLYGYYSTSYVPMSYRDGELRIKPTDINIEIAIK